MSTNSATMTLILITQSPQTQRYTACVRYTIIQRVSSKQRYWIIIEQIFVCVCRLSLCHYLVLCRVQYTIKWRVTRVDYCDSSDRQKHVQKINKIDFVINWLISWRVLGEASHKLPIITKCQILNMDSGPCYVSCSDTWPLHLGKSFLSRHSFFFCQISRITWKLLM